MKPLHLISIVGLFLTWNSAQAISVPGMNTIEMKCISYYDYPVDPIKEPGANPSAHSHTHYGVAVNENTNSKEEGDASQLHVGQAPPVQNIPGGGKAPFLDPGYNPLPSSCVNYGDWAWYAIPTPKVNGVAGEGNRSWNWFDTANHPRTVSVMTLTWAAPKGVPVYEPPFGMASIVGDPHTMSEMMMDYEHVYFTCGDLTTKSRAPRDCSGGTSVPLSTADYQAKADAAAASKTALDAAIAGGNHATILAAINDLSVKVAAMQASVTALQNAATSVTASGTPTEWEHNGLVTGVIVFPDCWNGQHGYPNFDSQFGIARSHFYFSSGGSCGAGVHIAQLYMSVVFGDLDTKKPMVNPINPDGSVKLSFASGPYYTFHADFGNMWNVELGVLVAGCLNHQDMYGGFAPLNNFGPSCMLPRCPAVSTDPGTLQFASAGVTVCKDQD